MTLESGQALLHYRLVDKLGEGGMGVVWKAVDTTLDREVAIKVLPQAFAADPERLARFEREARMLASVNHTNIATVYSVHQVEDLRFLAMELVDGEDLSALISRGRLALEEATVVAAQIADALETAHDRGMIHRDLKPANVMLSSTGQVKVLDFGLAKALEPQGGSSGDPSHSPTMTSAGTVPGVILGTAAYMSPEQARGQPVDRRADIWAFGCVLFEMLTGEQMFRGGTVSDTLAAILTREPDWNTLPSRLPASIRTLLERCLCKDPRSRLRDIGEARITLAAADLEPAAETESKQPRGRTWERLLGFVVIALLAAALIRVNLLDTQAPPDNRPPGLTMTRLTDLPGPERNPSLSPDGRMLLYDSAATGNLDVYLLRVGGARAINLTSASTVDDWQATFSPDGNSIAFRSERNDGGLFVMGATGESVRRVTDRGYNPAWSPDGKQLAFADEAVDDPYSRSVRSELWVVNIEDGSTTRLSERDAVQPAWSPDGRRIAYWSNTGGQRDIWTVGADGKDPVPVTQDLHTDWSPAWSPDGRWLYFSSDRGGSMNLWRTRFDRTTGRATGAPQRVTAGVRGIGHAGVAADGKTMAVMAYDRSAEITLHRLDPDDPCTIRSTTTLRQAATWCSISPDAQWLACTLRGAREDIVLIRADGSEIRRLTDSPSKDRFATWSPSGNELVFFSTRSGDWEHWAIRFDGSGLRQVTELGEISGVAWSPDGSRLAVNADYYAELWVVDSDRLSTRNDGWRLPLAVPGFAVNAWSAQDDLLAGVEVGEDGDGLAFGVYDIEAEAYRRLDLQNAGNGQGAVIKWLPDGQRLMADTTEHVVVYDLRNKDACELVPSGETDVVHLSGDGNVLQIERLQVDSEIWMLTMGGPE